MKKNMRERVACLTRPPDHSRKMVKPSKQPPPPVEDEHDEEEDEHEDDDEDEDDEPLPPEVEKRVEALGVLHVRRAHTRARAAHRTHPLHAPPPFPPRADGVRGRAQALH